MALKKEYVRSGNGGKLLGSITSGFSNDVKVVRDMHDNLLGSTDGRHQITRRGMSGSLISNNTADSKCHRKHMVDRLNPEPALISPI